MHAATNIHVARFYHPPSKRKNTTSYTPNLDYFRRQVDSHPEHLTLPYLTLPYLTLPYLTLPYLTFPYLTSGGRWTAIRSASRTCTLPLWCC